MILNVGSTGARSAEAGRSKAVCAPICCKYNVSEEAEAGRGAGQAKSSRAPPDLKFNSTSICESGH